MVTIWSLKVKEKIKSIKFVDKKNIWINIVAMLLTLIYIVIMFLEYKQMAYIDYQNGILKSFFDIYTLLYIPCLLLLFLGKKVVLPDIKEALLEEDTFSYKIKEEQYSTQLFPFSFGNDRYLKKLRVLKIESEANFGNEYIEKVLKRLGKIKKEYGFIKFNVLSRGDGIVLKMENAVPHSKRVSAKYVVGLIISMYTITEDIIQNVGDEVIN